MCHQEKKLRVCVRYSAYVCVCVMNTILSLPATACSWRLVFRYHLFLCHEDPEPNITFYHPQHKPDKLCPCPCASLLAAIITHCGSDIELAHRSGHAALFMMCPHSSHLLYQQCEGRKCKAAVEQVLNLEQHSSPWLLIQIALLMITCHYFRNGGKYLKLTGMQRLNSCTISVWGFCCNLWCKCTLYLLKPSERYIFKLFSALVFFVLPDFQIPT